MSDHLRKLLFKLLVVVGVIIVVNYHAKSQQKREPIFTEDQLQVFLIPALVQARIEYADLKVTKIKEPKISIVVNEQQWKNGGKSSLAKVLAEAGWQAVDDRTFCLAPMMLTEVINCPSCTPVELRLSQYDQYDKRCWIKELQRSKG